MNNYMLVVILFLTPSFVKSQILNIPDDNFKNALLSHSPMIDINGDNEIQISEANNFYGMIDVSTYTFNYEEMIIDFTGIEAFVNMSGFIAFGHKLYSGGFDFSFNQLIAVIDVSDCLVSEIDISSNNNLIELNLNRTLVNGIDVSHLLDLEVLDLGYTGVSTIDISSNDNLIELDISGTQIDGIDVSHLLDLEIFKLRHTDFSTIDISENINLKELSFFAGNINSIDLSNNLALETLSTGGAPLSSLDLTSNPNLKYLEMQSSSYSTIDLTQNINLEHIACYGSSVLDFDLSQSINLKYFGCGNNLFKSLDFSNNINFERLVSQGNEYLETINLKNGNNLNFTYFEVLNHPNLVTVCVDDVIYAAANFTNIDNPDVYDDVCDEVSSIDLHILNNVNVYPNPVIDGNLYIQLSSSIQVNEFFLIDLSGRTIEMDVNSLSKVDNQISLKADIFSSNIFFLKLITSKGIIVKKIVYK